MQIKIVVIVVDFVTRQKLLVQAFKVVSLLYIQEHSEQLNSR